MPRGVPNRRLCMRLDPSDEQALDEVVARLAPRMGFLDNPDARRAAREMLARACLRQGLRWMLAEDAAERDAVNEVVADVESAEATPAQQGSKKK